MMEAGVAIDHEGQAFYWHLPLERTAGSLPDSRDLWWDCFWGQRAKLAGFAHSHPGSGTPGPSYEDVTTFAAVEAALGRRLDWWITSSDTMIVVRWVGPQKLDYAGRIVTSEPEWVQALRLASVG